MSMFDLVWCPTCDGTGVEYHSMGFSRTCQMCRGTSRVPSDALICGFDGRYETAGRMRERMGEPLTYVLPKMAETEEKELVYCFTCDGTGEVHSHNPRWWDCGGMGKVPYDFQTETSEKLPFQLPKKIKGLAGELRKIYGDPVWVQQEKALEKICKDRENINIPSHPDILFELIPNSFGVDCTPKMAHPTDACFDLVAAEEFEIHVDQNTVIKTGVKFQIPHGWYGQILPRSGLASKGITVHPGVIDSGYAKEILVIAWMYSARDAYFGYPDYYTYCVGQNSCLTFPAGSRVAQIQFVKLGSYNLLPGKVEDTARGGLGSTGV